MLIIATSVVVIAGLSRLTFDVQILKMLPQEIDQVRGLSLLLEHFGLPREVIATLEVSDADQAEQLANSLANFLLNKPGLVSGAVWRPPLESDPECPLALAAYAAANAPPERFETLLEQLDPVGAEERAREKFDEILTSPWLDEAMLLSHDPFSIIPTIFGQVPAILTARSDFVSEDGLFRAIYLEAPESAIQSYKTMASWLAQLEAAIDIWKISEGVKNLTQQFSFWAGNRDRWGLWMFEGR